MAYRRVRKPQDKDDLLNRLTGGNPFETYREALIFAGAYGFAHARRVPFEKASEPISWEVFSGAPGAVIIDMIAAATSDQLEVLGEEDDDFDRRLTLFEEYANGGLELLRERLENDSRSELDVILDAVLAAEGESAQEASVDLAAIADELSS